MAAIDGYIAAMRLIPFRLTVAACSPMCPRANSSKKRSSATAKPLSTIAIYAPTRPTRPKRWETKTTPTRTMTRKKSAARSTRTSWTRVVAAH